MVHGYIEKQCLMRLNLIKSFRSDLISTHVDDGLWNLRTQIPECPEVSFFSFSYSDKEWHLKSIHPTRPNSGWHQDKPPAPTAQDTEARWDIIPLVCSGYASGSLPTLMWPANRPQHADNSIIIALLQVSSNITLRLVKHIHIYRKASV